MQRSLITLIILAFGLLGLTSRANADVSMTEIYKKIKMAAPLHVVVKLDKVKRASLALGTCYVAATITRVFKTTNSEWRARRKIRFGIKCKKANAFVSPKDPTNWIDATSLRKGVLVEAYLMPTDRVATFKTVKYNLVRVLKAEPVTTKKLRGAM